MAWWVKCLLCKREELSSDSPDLCGSVLVTPSAQGEEGQKQADLGTHRPASPVKISSSRFSERLFQKIRQRVTEEENRCQPLPSLGHMYLENLGECKCLHRHALTSTTVSALCPLHFTVPSIGHLCSTPVEWVLVFPHFVNVP